MSISPIVLREIGTGEGDNRTPLRKNSVTPPLVSTVSEEARQGVRGGGNGGGAEYPDYNVIFSEDFNEQPDYHSGMYSSSSSQLVTDGITVPDGWHGIRQDPSWAPSRGHTDRHESIEILAANSNKARGESGKSFVSWRDSATPGWVFEDGQEVPSGSFIIMRHRSSDSVGVTKTTSITVSGNTYTFNSTTSAEPSFSNPPRSVLNNEFQPAVNCAVSTIVESGPIQITDGGSATISGDAEYMVASALDNWPEWNRWNSESILSWYDESGMDELYVEFYLAFSDQWTQAGNSKIFRVSSWSEQGSFYGFGGGRENGPVMIYDYRGYPSSGVRNRISFRSGTHGTPYSMPTSRTSGLPRSLGNSGDLSANWTNDVIGQIPDKLNGGFLSKEFGEIITHEQLYGPPGTYTKHAFYLKMNQSPGAMDGKFIQWFEDQKVIDADMAWVPSGEPVPKWNTVSIGGNDFFRAYLNLERHEEWYSIDDLLIANTIPEELR